MLLSPAVSKTNTCFGVLKVIIIGDITYISTRTVIISALFHGGLSQEETIKQTYLLCRVKEQHATFLSV